MTSRLTRRATISATALLCTLLCAGAALALDKDDILRLHEAGLDAGTIVNVIRGTTEDLEITEADIEELEAAGLPEPILAELRLRLGVSGGEEPGTGTPTLQQELEEQRRLEEERRRLEQERIQRERDAMRGQIERETEAQQSLQAEFAALRRASEMVSDGDYMRAAAAYNRFLEEANPDPLGDEYYEAKFGLVNALYRAGLRGAIRADALEVALMGSGRRHFAAAVHILRDVVNDSGFNSPRIADLSNEVVAELPAGFQDEFNYFMGRYYYQASEFTQALNYLDRVDHNGEYAARAAFLSGVILVNPEVGENVRAVQSLQSAVLSADMEDEDDREVVENAYLALARIAYQVGNLGGASFYYQKISPESQRATTALFEGGWTHFLAGDLNRALGSFHSLHSPYHNHRFFPDLYVLEAAAYLYSCNVDEAREALATFEDEIGALRENLRAFVAEAEDPMVYYRAMLDPEEADRRGDPSLPGEARRWVLGDADFFRLYRVLSQLQGERELLTHSSADLGERGATTQELLESDISNRRLEVAVLIHDVVQDLLDELDDWWFKAREVSIEVGDLEAQYLQAILAEGEGVITEGTTFVIVADDWLYWPWEGEYWLDEVGNYRGNLTTRCPDVVEF